MDLIVYADGYLQARKKTCRAVYGRGGIGQKRREGDGISPIGKWPLRSLFYRADRITSITTGLPLHKISPADGWCDAPEDPHYNQLVHLPYTAHAESLWREDWLYDLIVVLGYNDAPVVQGQGSALFLHIFRGMGEPTEGCAAISFLDLYDLIPYLSPASSLIFTSECLKDPDPLWP